MAKNKSKSQQEEVEELVDQSEVSYEEEVGGEVANTGDEQGFFVKNRNMIIIAVIAIVGIGGYMLWQSNKGDSENQEALGEMAMAEVMYQADSTAQSINENVRFVGFQSIIDQYGGTDAANLARYYSGTGNLKMGQVDAGLSYLEDFETDDNFLSAAALAAKAYAFEQKIDFASAAEAYQKAAVTPEENNFSTPMYLMDAARNFESAGNSAKALEVYQRIRKDFPRYQSVQDQTVDKYIYKLGGNTDV